MFSSLKNLFGGKEDTTPVIPAGIDIDPAPVEPPSPAASAFLCREAVFDRNNRLAGHLFSLRQTDAPVSDGRQRQFDQILLDTLNASPDAWNTSRAFIPLNSASLDIVAVDRLKTANLVLLIHLAADAEPEALSARLETLRQRGLGIGIFRQPDNPAFTQAIGLANFGVIDARVTEPSAIRDFSAAFRASDKPEPGLLFATHIDTLDEHRFCHQWHFDFFHGRFSVQPGRRPDAASADPHKVQLLHLLRLVQGEAETAEITEAMKRDPLLTFRILRYLNSPALGLSHRIESLHQALIILGRQRLTRWLSVLLFSVHEPNFGDWLMVESALTRGRMMEALGAKSLSRQAHDSLFLTGIFSCLDRLLHRPLAEILDDMPLSEDVRAALIERRGPYAALLAVAEAGEAFDLARMESTAQAAGLDPEAVNHALLAATAWASEVTEHWE